MAEDWEKRPKMLTEELLDAYRKKPKLGDAVISPTQIDQITTVNPVTLPGQSDIIYNIWLYRSAKWHWNAVKADEFMIVEPTAPPSHAALMGQKERLESHIKAGLASAAQAVADYELLKHDERKYREILDYFKMGQKDQHVLRALFVDRVDAHTGEGYSMISMARRWPTIISDFIKMQDEWTDVKNIRAELKVSDAEAVVLKTKNELFKEWKRLFFPDVRDRYSRIKNLLESRKKSVDEYRDWLKPYVEKYKKIKEQTLIRPSADLVNPLAFAHNPWGQLGAKLWFWKGIRPEEMGKPLFINKEIPIYDDWVKEQLKKVEEIYGVKFYESKKEVKELEKKGELENPYYIIVEEKLEEFQHPSHTRKKLELLSVHAAPFIDPRYLYYMFVEIDYEVNYVKSATGPLEMEDQYFHIHPFLISQNSLLLFLLELSAKERAFDKYVDSLIGVKEVEESIRKRVEKEFEEKKVGEKKGFSSIKSFSAKINSFRERMKPIEKRIVKFFKKPGPYETTVRERINKTFGDYMGPQTAELSSLIKETCFKLSGQKV